MRYYLSHYMRDTNGKLIPPAQWHLAFMQEVFATVGTKHAGAYLAPRGYAKSTIVSLALPTAMMARKLKRYIWLIEDTGGQAAQALQAITAELEANERIKNDFPHLKPTMDHRNRAVADRDDDLVLGPDLRDSIRIQALGAGQKVRGRRHQNERPDLILGDDLENDETVLTKYQREKQDMWLSSAVMGARGPHTDTYIVGTLLHFDAVLARLMKREGWRHKRYDAMTDAGDFSTSTWPEFWTEERLQDQLQQMGWRAFSREVLHQPVNEDEQLFKRGYFKHRDAPIRPEITTIRIAVDPATGEKSSSDYSAIMVVGRTESYGKPVEYDVLEAWRGRMRGENLQAQVRNVYEKWLQAGYRPIVLFEAVQAQVWASQFLQARGMPVRPIRPNRDKVLRAEPAATLYEQGSVFHATELEDGPFELELEQFPSSEFDDLVDALVYALTDLSTSRSMRLRAVG